MSDSFNRVAGAFLFFVTVNAALAQNEGVNQLDVSLNMLGHGEARVGGFDASETENNDDLNEAYFLMERSRLTVDYKRPSLETKVTAQHSSIWGQKGQGSFNLYEAWVKLDKNGLFAQLGRQALSYDDERIIGPNDWAMAALSHDVLRMGYEGYGHKAHAILGFNQNAENTHGGTYYADGAQPYKTMMTAWYHYDVPKIPLGASVLFMNIGMQGGIKGGLYNNEPHTRFQQLLGGYMSYNPGPLTAEASYYRQMGHNEDNAKIDAWMASFKATWQFSIFNSQSSILNSQIFCGYDYLSGDEYFAVPPKGGLGLVKHDVVRGFNPLYGSHHKFYGMMDFFYVQTYLNGFTPGLQNLYAGVGYSPFKDLKLRATYHYMAMTTTLKDIDKTLGHDIDIEASYQIMKDVRFSAGFSYMVGTESMQRLQRADENNRLRWGWFSLIASPKIFTTKW
ncbi:MAG: alginate export family protein [Prevotella sp.]|jgi:hypothetical protein|nr:alginate export family protein [Prevotella sp.]